MIAQEAKQRLERIWKNYGEAYEIYDEDVMAFDMANNALGAIEQIQWERDMAIKQLHDLGYGLGEKPREEVKKSNQEVKKSNDLTLANSLPTCNNLQQVATDTISRQAAIDAMCSVCGYNCDKSEFVYDAPQDEQVILCPEHYALTSLPSAQPEPVTNCHDLTAAIDAIERIFDRCEEIEAHLPEGDPDRVGYKMYPDWLTVWKYLHQVPSAQPDVPDTNVGEMSRRFVELLAEYHDPEICPYKEYKGKPYFSIKYIENGEGYIGYGTYSPKVLSQYLREYFMATAQPERKTGKWITESLSDEFSVVYSLKCSECGEYSAWEYNFCPKCGADMRGDSDVKQ